MRRDNNIRTEQCRPEDYFVLMKQIMTQAAHTIRYDTIEEFNVDSKAEYSA